MHKILILIATSLFAVPAFAADQIALNNNVFVERVTTDTAGKRHVLLEEPKIVVPGDQLVFVLNYRNAGARPADRFVITNPMPAAVQFQDGGDDNPVVSVDGGDHWGALADLTVKLADGTTRRAQASDVTHVRWAFQKPIPVGGAGKLMFRGVVK